MSRTYITNTEFDVSREYFDEAKVERYLPRIERDGKRHIDINVGEASRQELLRTAGGRWVLATSSSVGGGGTEDNFAWAAASEAQDWLLFNGHDDAALLHFGPSADERGPGRPEIGGRVSIRLGDLIRPVDAYATEHGLSRADAVRILVEQALGSRRGDGPA